MSVHVAHWDDAPQRRVEIAPLVGTWWDLGAAAGSVGLGLRRVAVDPGKRSTPAHAHGAEEEVFFILEGTGLSWQGGLVVEVGPGDCLVHPAEGEPHTLVAGGDGLDALAFGTRVPVEACWLPRAGIAWLGGATWTEVGHGGHPYVQEAASGELDLSQRAPREGRVVRVDELPAVAVERGDTCCTCHDLVGARLQRSGLSHIQLQPGGLGFPPHMHTAEEELFVVLAGEGALELYPCGGSEVEPATLPLRRGSVVARPPSSGTAHALRGGSAGMTYLAYREHDPRDLSYYPRSRKLALKGGTVIGRFEPLDYWDGEE